MTQPISVFWFRRDLRLEDNAGLYHALRSGKQVLPVFIFDTEILDDLTDKKDIRICFIHDNLQKIQDALIDMGSSLFVLYGNPYVCFQNLLEKYQVKDVYTNEDYEPYAVSRDKSIEKLLKEQGIAFHCYKDQLIFAKDEIQKNDRTPYIVFTPYSRKWKEQLSDFYLRPYRTENYFQHFLPMKAKAIPSLRSLGFERMPYTVPEPDIEAGTLRQYEKIRDIPSEKGTTCLSVHLRFGTVSVRSMAGKLLAYSETALNELIWREFFASMLWHFPYTMHAAFKPAYDRIRWRNDEQEFEAWCAGKTGYPLVDAGLRQLNQTGWMHNRVRMVAASFLCKHLLIDWRWGEAYFAKKLLDYDMAQNVGNWQWVAGSGADAAPYFRIFNPLTQQHRFDPDKRYIKRWIPELETPAYPGPIVYHEQARERCLSVYKTALK